FVILVFTPSAESIAQHAPSARAQHLPSAPAPFSPSSTWGRPDPGTHLFHRTANANPSLTDRTRIRAPILSSTGVAVAESGRRRSIPLAAGLSAVVPGAGQAYNRQWIKTVAAVALESAMIVAYAVWRADGLDAEQAYQAYAHAHWDPSRYARWL